MIKMSINSRQFQKDMRNIVQYSYGFIDGVQKGKKIFYNNLGIMIKEVLESFVDSNARLSPQTLHHVYEWYRTGSPGARLFDITYIVNTNGLSFQSTFKQSNSLKIGSRVPFYDKAKIMEDGISVTIRPKYADALVFEDQGEEIFTKGSVTIDNPGGEFTQGGFEKTIDLFFRQYFAQSFLRASGILDQLQRPTVFKKNIRAGKNGGKAKGVSTGFTWITNIGVGRNG
jgi:hypothetical protein